MTSKEALNLFKQYQWSIKDKEKALEILEEIVERDTPKKPYDIFYNHKNKYKRLYTCPYCRNVCLKKYQNERQLNNYCGDCGQKIDWSDS